MERPPGMPRAGPRRGKSGHAGRGLQMEEEGHPVGPGPRGQRRGGVKTGKVGNVPGYTNFGFVN